MQFSLHLLLGWVSLCVVSFGSTAAAAAVPEVPLWNQQQIMAEYLGEDPIYKTAKFGAVVAMTADGTTYLAGRYVSCVYYLCVLCIFHAYCLVYVHPSTANVSC